MSQRRFWWKGEGKEKKTSGFGSKLWISFQAWTLRWAFQQMSKSLLAADRQPNGPQRRRCGRATHVEGEGGRKPTGEWKEKKQQRILMQLLTKKQLIEKKLNKFLSCVTALVASNFICASLLWHGSQGTAVPPELWLSSTWGSRFHTEPSSMVATTSRRYFRSFEQRAEARFLPHNICLNS